MKTPLAGRGYMKAESGASMAIMITTIVIILMVFLLIKYFAGGES
jgi:hypothetical protein